MNMGELFFSYTGISDNYRQVFFGFLDENCNYSRGQSEPFQSNDYENTQFLNVIAKTGKDYVYVITQQYSISQPLQPNLLYILIVDISDTTTYIILKYEKIATRNVVWDYPQNSGIFTDLVTNYNSIQNKIIQIENTNKFSIVSGDRKLDIFTIYTFQYNGKGLIQDICLKTYSNQFQNVGSDFFKSLEFGIINEDFMWIKGDNQNQNDKTIIFFANPQDCKVYKNYNHNKIYQYQLQNFGFSHILHTYYNNNTVSLITSSSWINGNKDQNLQANRIDIGENCPKYCLSCTNFTTCDKCVSANVQRNISNICLCPEKYYQNELSDDCLQCPEYCLLCSDSMTCQKCISSSGKRDISNLCQCQESFYQDIFSNDCKKCPQQCATCSDSNTCHSCLFPSPLRNLTNQCDCNNGYFQDQNSSNCLCIDYKDLIINTFSKNYNFSFIIKLALRNVEHVHLKIIVKHVQLPISLAQTVIYQYMNTLSTKKIIGNRQDLSENCDCLPGFHDNMGLYKKCIKCPLFCKNCINEKCCTECDYGYVLNKINHQCGKCAHGEIWNQFKKQCQKCFYYKKDCVFQCPENTVEKKFNTCVEKEYIEYQSYEYWLIIFGSICIIQQIIFFIFLDWKIKKIIKYEVQKQKEEVIKNYELMAEEEYQQKQKFAEPSVQQKDKQKLKENLSLLIMNQNLLKIIKKEYSQENQKDSQQLQQNQQEQIQTDNLKNTQSELNQEIQVEKKKKKLQNKKRMKKKKELKKIYNRQDSLSITINNNSNSKPKTNSNLKNIQMKTFIALKK
ncbi:Insulin-like growth factor binding protein, N-terminal [Pseudocohnilembus persalinus]|uniref:Insulin-like growth factor binding protein, N-terminal n=1 Tax=Pseudocohnilembus persalinus TaxID=266149 RepID=A0A0V0R609_PSEPJ|nr:Insulin-like growth factor binding protein, N-terminal [Pseudocohnilembus persalinus]|eukprot:KRX09935.1 Insulin-like growth factor binding protein, N-terminal [Pseudocohnilembus persalinus]